MKKKYLEETITKCFEIVLQQDKLENGSRSERVDLSRVHALNVLRLILADSSLSSLTREYIGKCFEMCIELFSSQYFPIRNCAAMVFCTLVSKGFGSMKAKIESPQASLVFSHDFFVKFPTLYTVALSSLETSVATLSEKRVHPTLYPTLSILSRLKGADSEYYDMKPFEDLILECSAASMWKVREVAANTLCGLIQPSSLLKTIEKCIEKMVSANSNYVHGLALQIRALCDFHLPLIDPSYTLPSHFAVIFASLMSSVQHVFTVSKYSVARGVLLDLVFRLFIKNDFHLPIEQFRAKDVDDLLSLVGRVSIDVLTGQTTTLFCPSYDIATAAKIVLFTTPLSLLSVINATDDFYSITLLEAIHEHFDRVSSNEQLNKCIVQTCTVILYDTTVVPELVSISCKLALKIEDFKFTETFEVSMRYWLSQPFIPFSLIESMLQLSCKYLFEATLPESELIATVPPLWSYFVNRAKACLDPATFPSSLRLAIGESLFSTCSKFITTDSSLFVDLAILLDELVLDDDKDVRIQSVKVMSYYMKTKVSATPTVARKAWGPFVLEKIKEASVVDSLSKWINHHVRRLTLSNPDVVQSVLKADTLFDAEDFNGFREHHLVSALSHSILDQLLLSDTASTTNDLLQTRKIHVKKALSDHIDVFVGILEPWRDDLEWRAFCETDVFNCITEISYCASLVNRQLPSWMPVVLS